VNLANLGETYQLLGRLDTAYDHLTEALALQRAVGDRGAEAESLRVLAAIRLDQGKYDRALDLATEAAALAADTGHRPIETNARNTLGAVRLRLDRPAAARADHERALHLAREAGTRYAEVLALIGLAACHLQLRHHDHAHALAEQAHGEADRTGFRVVAALALTTLLDINLSTGNVPRALAYGQRALTLHRVTGHRHGEARTALLLGHVLHAAHRPAAAHAAWRTAATLFTDIGAPEAAVAHALLNTDLRPQPNAPAPSATATV
jgi:tetratricopeptide (TPR) repeat protein